MTFRHRLATQQDIPAIIDLMKLSIEENMKTLLSCEEIEAAKETMGVDQTLIDDGTYFVIEVDTRADAGRLRGLGKAADLVWRQPHQGQG